MARADLAPEDRDVTVLQLEQFIDCPECQTTFDHVFTAADGIFDKEDLVEAPIEEVVCPYCHHEFSAEYEGWHVNDEA